MLFPIYRKAYTAFTVFLPSDKGSAIWQTSCCNEFITLKYKKALVQLITRVFHNHCKEQIILTEKSQYMYQSKCQKYQ